MITLGILSILYAFIWATTYPLRFLSDVVLDSGITSSITTAGEYLSIMNFVIPISTLASVIAIFLSIEGSILTYRLIMWTIKKIPGIN